MPATARKSPSTPSQFRKVTEQETDLVMDLHGHLDDWLDNRAEFADINSEVGALLRRLGWQPSPSATLFVWQPSPSATLFV